MKRTLMMLGFVLPLTLHAYDKIENGIMVNLADKDQTLELSFVSDRIVHIKAWPGNKAPQDSSLIVLPEAMSQKISFKVLQKEDSLFLSTAKLRVALNTNDGGIVFRNSKGETLLQEISGGAKQFLPIVTDQEAGYSIVQQFESTADEAFYGLGQHQSEEFNYKGKNEELYQYNTKVSNPFIVSNKGYGILWDNYSLTRFGDPRPYDQLSQFKLYDKQGQEGALTAAYYTKDNYEIPRIERRESKIDYEDLETIENFPKISFNGAKIVWQGDMESLQRGLYHFKLYYAGYTKVFIDGNEVVPERWRTAWNPNSYKFTYAFEKGKRYSIRIEWKPDGGVSYLGLKALSPRSEKEQQQLSLWSEMADAINYYFIAGESADQIIGGYRQLTGKAPIMPRWAFGFWQSRERYKTQKEIVGTLAEFRKRNFPIDNIVQDWSYWKEDQWGSHEFDPKRFPDPKKMVQDIHDMQGRIMISVWPKFYVNTKHYDELNLQGWIYPQAVQDSIKDWIGKGYIGSFYDAYAPGARKLFWQQIHDQLYTLGIDAWWMDASEPDILSNASIEYRKKLSTPTALGSSTKYFNTYALMNADAIYNGQRGVDPNKRVFLLTRSGFAGTQRYSTATWSGDIGTRWEDMKAQITAGLNFAISGIPYWTMDIGGFCVEKRYEDAQKLFNKTGEENEDLKEWRELNTRWYQFGAFAPLYRSHGQFPYREPFNIAPENHPAYQSMLAYTQLRYRLMPYIYSLAGMAYLDDYTLMRALVMDFPEDERVIDIEDQYMFGPGLMICPVYTYKARERKVYLPQGQGWYDFYTNKYYSAGTTITASAPYERIPLFVPAGTIIPMGKDVQNTQEKTDGVLTLRIYAGADGQFTLYEDQGENYDYEQGKYSTIMFKYDDRKQMLEIGKRKGEFEEMYRNREIKVVFINPEGEEKPLPSFKYNGQKKRLSLKE